MSPPAPRRVFISVAEDSADVHAASLILAARKQLPDVQFFGLTGPRMRAAGVETLFDLSAHAAMLTGAVGLLQKALRARRVVEAAWREQPPDACVFVDSPELHLPLARSAKRSGLPVLYYVAPQTWASREGRNRRIAECVDHLACILPFEQAYFRRAGVRATFVGHPLFEALGREVVDPASVSRLRQGNRPLVVLLPGSRKHVIKSMLPLQLDVLALLRADGQTFRAAVSAVDEPRAAFIQGILAQRSAKASVEIVTAQNASLLTAADLVLVASGTATLHVAAYRKPMIVMYDAGRLLELGQRYLGRGFLKTPHLSLVNILAGRRVAPEFMPFAHDAAAIARVASQLLTDRVWQDLMRRQLDELVRPLECSQASGEVCRLLSDLLGQGRGREAAGSSMPAACV